MRVVLVLVGDDVGYVLPLMQTPHTQPHTQQIMKTMK
jgi:hypothetical protein